MHLKSDTLVIPKSRPLAKVVQNHYELKDTLKWYFYYTSLLEKKEQQEGKDMSLVKERIAHLKHFVMLKLQ